MTEDAPLPRWVCAVARCIAAETTVDRWLAPRLWDLTVAAIAIGIPCVTLMTGNVLSTAILLNAIPQQGIAGLIVLALTAVMDLFAGYIVVTTWVARRYGDALAERCRTVRRYPRDGA